jgi:hypothetical protein
LIIDTNRRLTPRLDCLQSAGVKSVIRYYARATSQSEKRLTRAEAEAVVASGLSVAAVHQAGGASPESFSKSLGKMDAEYAFRYAIETIGQPAGSAIYFGVDFDCDARTFADRVLPHFKAIEAVSNSGEFSRRFEIGVYGNGLVLGGLLDAGLCKYAWLSQSTGHHDSRQFKASGRWTLAQRLPSSLCGMGLDANDLNPAAAGFGDFATLLPLTVARPVAPGDASMRFRTTASAGLRLREGPGTQFEVIRLLPPGTVVTALTLQGDWAIVDLEGDGLAEGAVHAAFLAPF